MLFNDPNTVSKLLKIIEEDVARYGVCYLIKHPHFWRFLKCGLCGQETDAVILGPEQIKLENWEFHAQCVKCREWSENEVIDRPKADKMVVRRIDPTEMYRSRDEFTREEKLVWHFSAEFVAGLRDNAAKALAVPLGVLDALRSSGGLVLDKNCLQVIGKPREAS
jgi:hypothetical protein